jgi:aryl-alcohol dehydrogenase-like predicted oxidoreductase
VTVEYRALGGSDVSLSAVGLGCEPLGGADWGSVDIEQAIGAVRSAWTKGVTVFDTADAYGLGLSEERLASALGNARHEAVIVTKGGVRWKDRGGQRAQTWIDASPSYLVSALDASLNRLGVERIPIYLVHWPDERTPLEDTLECLSRQRNLGKIGLYGVSNHWSTQLHRAAICGAEVVELPLSLIDRRAEEEFADISRLGLGLLAYGAYAQGLLCDKYDASTKFGTDDRRHRLPQFSAGAWPTNERLLTVIREIATVRRVAASQVTLRWVLENSEVACAIVGAKTPAQVLDLTGASQWRLSVTENASLSAAAAPPGKHLAAGSE